MSQNWYTISTLAMLSSFIGFSSMVYISLAFIGQISSSCLTSSHVWGTKLIGEHSSGIEKSKVAARASV